MKPSLRAVPRSSSALALPSEAIADNTAQYLEADLKGAANTQRADLADFEAFLYTPEELLGRSGTGGVSLRVCAKPGAIF